MSPFRVRVETLADDELVVVRGALLEVERLRRDALMAFRRFGEYGVSVLAAPDDTALDVIARTTLLGEDVLTLATAGAIRRTGLELRPTFHRPHYSVMLPDFEADLIRLVSCETVVQDNPHHRPPEALR